MLATLIAAPLLFAQSATAVMVKQEYETRDVAFGELTEGDPQVALAQLEAALADNPGDPAILINLGAAHARLGNFERAEFFYRAARESTEQYELELADGRWLDSREAATLALASVQLEALAAR